MNLQYVPRRASVAAFILVCAGFSLASMADAASAVTYDFATAQKARSQVQSLVTAGRTAQAKQLSNPNAATSGGVQPTEAFANVERAYPPSCLESPIALGLYTSHLNNALQTQIRLYGDSLGSAAEQAFSEVDTVTLFRVVCSAGKSATLLEIDRPSGHDTTLYPIFPAISVAQGSNNLYIRLTDDPNTFFATTFAFSPLANSNVYVLENVYGGAVQFDYNQAFTLTVDNLNANDPARLNSFLMPTYDPAQYSESSLPLPISGYMSTNWTSQTQGGEGIVMQIYDNRDQATRTLAFAWFTYDNLGLPFWLYGEADNFAIGTRSVSATTAYFKGGTFAGNTPNGIPPTIWGTVAISFPDCAHMNIAYNGDASAVNGPTGSGNKQFSRVADVNGLICQ